MFNLLNMMLLCDLWGGHFSLRGAYSWDVNQMDALDATGLERMVREQPRQMVLLLSGTDPSTGDRIVFGALVPRPDEDGRAIALAADPYDNNLRQKSALLFQLSPVVRRFDGIVGRPGWNLRDGDLVFGEPGNGAALVIDECLSMGVLTQDVGDDNQEVYRTVPWGAKYIAWEIEDVEVWCDADPPLPETDDPE